MKHYTKVDSNKTKLVITFGGSSPYLKDKADSMISIYGVDYTKFIYELDDIMRFVAQFITANTAEVKLIGYGYHGFLTQLVAVYLAQMFKASTFKVLVFDAPVKIELSDLFTNAYPKFKSIVGAPTVWPLFNKYADLTSVLNTKIGNISIRYVYNGTLSSVQYKYCTTQAPLAQQYPFVTVLMVPASYYANSSLTDAVFASHFAAEYNSFLTV